MKRPNYMEQIKERIDEAKPGAVFVPSDFFDIADAGQINMCLMRLKQMGILDNVMRGVFGKRRFSEFLKTNVPPHSDDIARAIARNYGWTIIPCGDTALNILGLSTQIPTAWSYVSDGPYKSYEAGGVKLNFKRTNKKNEIIEVSYKTALVIQALRALGKDNVTDEVIYKLTKVLSVDEKERMLTEGQRITTWIYGHIKRICAEDKND